MTPLPPSEIKSKRVCVKTFFRGFHCWPDAPEEVFFLRSLHRHQFGVRVEVEVTGSNREVEFFILQKRVDLACQKVHAELLRHPHFSCEMMAEKIALLLFEEGFKVAEVEVDEDRENRGKIIYAT